MYSKLCLYVTSIYFSVSSVLSSIERFYHRPVIMMFSLKVSTVIFLPAHPASFTHNLVSIGCKVLILVGPRMRCFLQICNEKECFGLIRWELDPLI